MKIIVTKWKVLFTVSIVLIFSFHSKAQQIKMQKKFNKTISLHNNQAVSIFNASGNVVVHNWNRNEVNVDVTIIARGTNAAAAQEILNAITIECRDENPVQFATKAEVQKNVGKGAITVNYTVYLPSHSKLLVNNNMGNTSIPSRSGVVNVVQFMGDLAIGALSNASKIDLKSGNVAIASLNNSNIKIENSSVRIKEMSGIIAGDFTLCNQLKLGATNGLKKLDLKVANSGAVLDLPQSFNGLFEIETKQGEFINKSSIKINQQTPDKNVTSLLTKKYAGRSGTGKAPVKIHNSFGNLLLE